MEKLKEVTVLSDEGLHLADVALRDHHHDGMRMAAKEHWAAAPGKSGYGKDSIHNGMNGEGELPMLARV